MKWMEWDVEKNQKIEEWGFTVEREVSKSSQGRHHLNWDLKDGRETTRQGEGQSKQQKQLVQTPWVREGFKNDEVGKPGRRRYTGSFKAKVRSLYFIPSTHEGFNTEEWHDPINTFSTAPWLCSAENKLDLWWGFLAVWGTRRPSVSLMKPTTLSLE